MRFRQLDKIVTLVPGQRIEAHKWLTGDEDYLRDHFPKFAVQPGVLMLESMFQAAQFLVRATEDYKSGLVMLNEAKNLKFAAFLKPGETLIVHAEIIKTENGRFTLKTSGVKADGTVCASARLVLQCRINPESSATDFHASQYIRQIVDQLQQVAMA